VRRITVVCGLASLGGMAMRTDPRDVCASAVAEFAKHDTVVRWSWRRVFGYRVGQTVGQTVGHGGVCGIDFVRMAW